MALEISEIGVKLAVGDGAQPAGTGPGTAGEAQTPAQRDNIVQACVRRVLQSLRIMKAR